MKSSRSGGILLLQLLLLTLFISSSTLANSEDEANSIPFDITVLGSRVDKKDTSYEMFDLAAQQTSIRHRFKNSEGREYEVSIKYKPLPSNRSYPGNLDITLSDAKGQKIGYLFFATNGLEALKSIGVFGLRVKDGDDLVDVRFIFDPKKAGSLQLADLTEERFVQDTLISDKGFQMIRPVILQPGKDKQWNKSFATDAHPFEVSFTAEQVTNGVVEFQHNLHSTLNESADLLISTYYHADSIETLRQGMFASKYFDAEYGGIKLVYYPALGQTEP